jgi:Beta-ketoacyl synthase, N-terminal domain
MSPTVHVGVQGIGLLGPGWADWAASLPNLQDPSTWQRVPTVVPPPARLPATERRRAGLVVKASVLVADQACAAAGLEPSTMATVFTSSTGDPANCHAMCEALASADRLISPTRFTNSVHNVAAGYWHIATHSMQASTSLGAFDASFAAGLLEAAVQCAATQAPVLLVACDVPYPEPLNGVRPVADCLAVALVLVPQGGRRLGVALAGDAPATPCADAALELLRGQIPAARALPLLQALTGAAGRSLVVEGLPGAALAVEVSPS